MDGVSKEYRRVSKKQGFQAAIEKQNQPIDAGMVTFQLSYVIYNHNIVIPVTVLHKQYCILVTQTFKHLGQASLLEAVEVLHVRLLEVSICNENHSISAEHQSETISSTSDIYLWIY